MFFLGSVGPDDFAKNYAGWAKKFGLADWADWLGVYATGPRVFWATVVVSFIYLMVAFGIPLIIQRSSSNMAAVSVPIIVLLLLLIAGYGQYQLVTSSVDPQLWQPLTPTEIESMTDLLSTLEPERVRIACETIHCKELALTFEKAFRNAKWPDVKTVFSGGLGITGQAGLVIYPGDDETDKITSAVESASSLKVTSRPYTRTKSDDPGIWFIIGTKPF
jgi:hypothetical protein